MARRSFLEANPKRAPLKSGWLPFAVFWRRVSRVFWQAFFSEMAQAFSSQPCLGRAFPVFPGEARDLFCPFQFLGIPLTVEWDALKEIYRWLLWPLDQPEEVAAAMFFLARIFGHFGKDL